MLQRINFVSKNRWAAVILMALVQTIVSYTTLEAQNATITGVIRNASGQPVAGAFVKIKNKESGLSLLVVSQDQGRYSTPDLLPGTYTVQGFGGTQQSELMASVEVADGRSGKADLVLSTARQVPSRGRRKTIEEYLTMLPEGEGKPIVLSHCTFCHGVERTVPARFSREAWQRTVDRMNIYLAGRPDLQKQHNASPIPEDRRSVLVDYLTKNFGLDAPPIRDRIFSGPNDNLPASLVKGPEAKFVAVELDWKNRFEVYDINVDSQGTVWVSGGAPRGPERFSNGTADVARQGGMLGRFDARSMTVVPIPFPSDKHSSNVGALAVDPQDQIWIADKDEKNNWWYQYNPKTNQFQTYDVPLPLNLPPSVLREPANVNTIRFLNGKVWGVGNPTSRVLRLDPNTRKVNQYPVPLGSHPHGIDIGGDKAIWYASILDQEVVRLDPNTGQLTHYKTNIPNAGSRMTADADGNLWIVSRLGKLAKVDYRTGKVTEYNIPAGESSSFAIDADTKRNFIWFDETDAGKIARFDPRTGAFTEFPLPTATMGYIIRVIVDPTKPNRVWWSAPGEIGYSEVIE